MALRLVTMVAHPPGLEPSSQSEIGMHLDEHLRSQLREPLLPAAHAAGGVMLGDAIGLDDGHAPAHEHVMGAGRTHVHQRVAPR